MTTIGTFTQLDDGAFSGAIRTLTLNLKAVQIRPVARAAERGPDFRVYAGDIEIGAAWPSAKDAGPGELSVRLDDPGFAHPVHARLSEVDGRHLLTWIRRRHSST